jgi:hypothetical protein
MVGSSDPSWRERYWISIQDTENRDTVLTCGIGQYPNQDVQEAFVVLAQGTCSATCGSPGRPRRKATSCVSGRSPSRSSAHCGTCTWR